MSISSLYKKFGEGAKFEGIEIIQLLRKNKLKYVLIEEKCV